MAQTDGWAAWLAQFRTGGDPALRERGFARLATWCDRILDNAELQEGGTVLDSAAARVSSDSPRSSEAREP